MSAGTRTATVAARNEAPAAARFDLATPLLAWWDVHGRKDLPWQHPRTPYRVWLSEVMLQQTQVATVIGYFHRFLDALPTLPALAAASQEQVLALWAGLGYYSRARNLHRAAQLCVERHGGDLPRDLEAMSALPGIGRSTAGAILAQAHGTRVAILDGNVKRVLARLHAVSGDVSSSAVQRTLWQHAEAHLPGARLADYTQALMDLGATVCTPRNPDCVHCPLQAHCAAFARGIAAELPEKRKARPVPVRQVAMLLAHDDARRVLLVKRAPQGIWGGLHSLPEAEDVDALQRELRERHGLALCAARPLPPFAHSFTHFRLEVAPMAAQVECPAPRVADDAGVRWLAPHELGSVGTPAPIKALLERFWELS